MYGFGRGAFAEYIAVRQGSLAPKPANLTFEQAAAVPLAAVTALQGLRAGGIQPGQHVLIIGASGGVGTCAVQIARHLGARVTGVCSTPNVDVVHRLGAEHVIDYAKQDFTPAPPATTWPSSWAAPTLQPRSGKCSHHTEPSSSPSATAAAGSAR